MPYTADSIDFPSTPVVGEPFTINATYCSTAEDNRETEARLFFDGSEIGSAKLVSQGAFCADFNSGAHIFRQPPSPSGPNYELDVNRFGGGPITVTESGAYDVTLSIIGGGQLTETVEVVESVLDPSLVEAGCPNVDSPDDPSPGDTVTLTSRVSNANDSPVMATVTTEFGSATDEQTVTVPANGSEDVSATFTPEDATEYTIKRPTIDALTEA